MYRRLLQGQTTDVAALPGRRRALQADIDDDGPPLPVRDRVALPALEDWPAAPGYDQEGGSADMEDEERSLPSTEGADDSVGGSEGGDDDGAAGGGAALGAGGHAGDDGPRSPVSFVSGDGPGGGDGAIGDGPGGAIGDGPGGDGAIGDGPGGGDGVDGADGGGPGDDGALGIPLFAAEMWGCFRLTPKHPAKGRPFGGIQADCPYHRLNNKTGCRKYLQLRDATAEERDKAVRALKGWCTDALNFSRQRYHRGSFCHIDAAPSEAILAASLPSVGDGPAAPPQTDAELDAVVAAPPVPDEAPVRGRGGRGRAAGRAGHGRGEGGRGRGRGGRGGRRARGRAGGGEGDGEEAAGAGDAAHSSTSSGSGSSSSSSSSSSSDESAS